MENIKFCSLQSCLILIFAGLHILSCENSESKKRLKEKEIQDSILLVQERNQEIEQDIIDSIQHAEESKVIGDIRFGMNLNDFEKKKDELMENCKVLKFQYGETKRYCYKIGEYEFIAINGYFHEEKLYSVQIRGEYMEYTSYDELMSEQSIALYKVLKTKYGMPVQNYAIPDWYTLNHGDSNCLAFWKMGDKIVEMRIEKFRTNYYLNIEIFQSSISSKLQDEKRERKIKEEKEKVQKATEIL